ncbi:UNVERIFIED_CONTAM: hypothetical protein Sangu_2981600 [Sesamum angustifolium]|uniref:Uncharacterized protein n=1 Tax=Sesamum angustifolium TaxID=2727405 RepID=A0AAW2IIU4_9LAMI
MVRRTEKWDYSNGISIRYFDIQVALTPPGGMWQDWGPNAATSNTTSSAVSTHKPGETILYDLERKKFLWSDVVKYTVILLFYCYHLNGITSFQG